MNYGELMWDIRFDHYINQKQMAKILGINPVAYNMYEKQTLIIPMKYLIKFCDYFDISTDYILGFSKERNNPNIIKNISKKDAGMRLRKFRKHLKLNQQEFADIFNVTNFSLSAYERGVYFIPTELLYKICKKYKKSSDYLLGRLPEDN